MPANFLAWQILVCQLSRPVIYCNAGVHHVCATYSGICIGKITCCGSKWKWFNPFFITVIICRWFFFLLTKDTMRCTACPRLHKSCGLDYSSQRVANESKVGQKQVVARAFYIWGCQLEKHFSYSWNWFMSTRTFLS